MIFSPCPILPEVIILINRSLSGRSSPNFGKWFGIILCANNKKAMYIPPNFAHGFCVLTERAEFFYK